MIKTVIFDLGKVLIPFEIERGYRALSEGCGLEPTEIRRRIAATDLVMRFESGLVEPEDFVRQLGDLLGLKVNYDRFCELWSSIFLPDPLLPQDFIESLRRRYRVLLLSNTNAIHFPMVRAAYPLLDHFDDYVLSYEVKAMKPSPLIYQEALRKAQCRPEECFYTDDIAAYVDAARELGIDAVQFQDRAQIQEEMRARGIQW
jgi:epoxide hydrolase-like predicted phosphatase